MDLTSCKALGARLSAGLRNPILRPFQYPSLKVPPAPVGAGQRAFPARLSAASAKKRQLGILLSRAGGVKDNFADLRFSIILTKQLLGGHLRATTYGVFRSEAHKRTSTGRAESGRNANAFANESF